MQTATRRPRHRGWRAGRRCLRWPPRVRALAPAPSRDQPLPESVPPLAGISSALRFACSAPIPLDPRLPACRERDQLQHLARGRQEAAQAQGAAWGGLPAPLHPKQSAAATGPSVAAQQCPQTRQRSPMLLLLRCAAGGGSASAGGHERYCDAQELWHRPPRQGGQRQRLFWGRSALALSGGSCGV